jgi:hypothetical protein
MAKKPPPEYIPGVCNIGDTEAKSRLRMALLASVLTITIWASLLVLIVPTFTYLFLVLPAFAAATSYIQYKEHFCAGFGSEGFYNFSDKLGKIERSDNPDDVSKDRKKALSITIRALTVGIIVAAFAAGTAQLISLDAV